MLNTNYFFLEFLNLRKEFNKEIKNSYDSYIHYIENSLNNKVKIFWAFIRSKNNRNGYLCKMLFENNYASDCIANLIKIFFSVVYSHDDSVNMPDNDDLQTDPQSYNIEISSNDIRQSILKLMEYQVLS